MSDDSPLLQVKDLRTWFPIKKGILRRTVGHVRAVDGVSFSVEKGKTLALVGESGCGKTTVGRSILRLVEPQSGSVKFRGRELLGLSEEELWPIRQKMQMVFQDPMTSLNPRMRVLDLIAEGLDSFGLAGSKSEREGRVEQALLRVKLSADHMKRFPHEFSGGQRQRIGVARALAVEPELIVCDEAVSALDVSIQAQILNLLGQLQDDLGLSYVFITHDLSVVRYLADEVAVMYLGEIVETAPASDLFAEPRHPYTQGLVLAVPLPDPDREPVRAQVLGDVPSPAHPPSGCRFHTRCPKAFERCKVEAPRAYPRDGSLAPQTDDSGSARRAGQASCHLLDPRLHDSASAE
jgi:oligopeptide/dipeptide ABC transporter ATP-binding protein